MKQPYRRATTHENIQHARDTIQSHSNSLETDESIWKAIYSPAIRIRIHQFIFKAMHGRQKIGDFWSHIRGYEDRGICDTCQRTKSMEHILITCQDHAQWIIWDLAKDFWPHGDDQWPIIDLGMILSCGNLQTRPENEQAQEDNEPHRSW